MKMWIKYSLCTGDFTIQRGRRKCKQSKMQWCRFYDKSLQSSVMSLNRTDGFYLKESGLHKGNDYGNTYRFRWASRKMAITEKTC